MTGNYLSVAATCTAIPNVASCTTQVANVVATGCTLCATNFYLSDAATCTSIATVANCVTQVNN